MRHEVICVDDGSTDGTRQVLQAIGGTRVILLPCNQGSGTARRNEAGSYKLLRVPAKWEIRKLAAYLTSADIAYLNSGLRTFKRAVA